MDQEYQRVQKEMDGWLAWWEELQNKNL